MTSLGNTASKTLPGAVRVATAYDGYGRLTAYTRTGTQALTFAYNGLDDRVVMQAGSDVRRFVYDGDGRVLGEYGNSAADVKGEFVWLLPEAANDNSFGGGDGIGGYMPLAVATPDLLGAVQLRWVHGNHLGVPLVTNDAGGDPAPPGDYLAPGFPGQSRVLADLYYNRYRDYDPTTGRYVQADPIGLAGGSNPYGYVGGNPVRWADPMGLEAARPIPWGIPIPIPGTIGPDRNGNGISDWTEDAAKQMGRGLNDAGYWLCKHSAICRYFNPPKEDCPPDGNGGDSCVAGWMDEVDNYCATTFSGPAYRRCVNRANDRLRACKREGGHWPPSGPDRWSYQDEHRFRP